MKTETTEPSVSATISRRTALASAGAGVLFSALPFGTRRMAVAQTGGPAELIFRGGSIVTVEEAMPTAEAVAVAGGRILAVGTEAEVMALATDATRIVDLAGAALLPGFIDSHGHFMNALSIVNWVNVSGPPVGPVSSIADAVAAVRAFADERKLAPWEWIVGFGYDGTVLSDGREMTRDEMLQPRSAFPGQSGHVDPCLEPWLRAQLGRPRDRGHRCLDPHAGRWPDHAPGRVERTCRAVDGNRLPAAFRQHAET
jgi:hypothetical protein